ncbi:hypothetical protein DZG01_06085 [Pseudomonas fluorescens]|nr:hypothetical protein DZG01_06085 [Pseudomonas fluorescens]
MGASLLAKASAHSTSMQADPPPSRAGSLPQLDRGMTGETGRLSGRLREQARSHKRSVERATTPPDKPREKSPAHAHH